MKLLKIAAGSSTRRRSIGTATAAHRRAIAEARAAGASLLCLPELCITGYGCEDAFHSPGAAARRPGRCCTRLLPAHARHGRLARAAAAAISNALFNAACLVVDGRIAGFVAKQFLAGDGIHYEPRWFKPWPAGAARRSRARRRRAIRSATSSSTCGGVQIGFEICEDAWVADRPGSGAGPAAAST